eukprot:m.1331361 g.1331361  ORF g.1331361 m.1331361 type:complete len:149 (+) comp24864_c0_seq1:1133-1579(+)
MDVETARVVHASQNFHHGMLVTLHSCALKALHAGADGITLHQSNHRMHPAAFRSHCFLKYAHVNEFNQHLQHTSPIQVTCNAITHIDSYRKYAWTRTLERQLSGHTSCTNMQQCVNGSHRPVQAWKNFASRCKRAGTSGCMYVNALIT